MNTGISYYRFLDKVHADAMMATVADDKSLTFFEVPPRGTTTGEGESVIFTPFAEYIVGCVNYASILPVEDWEQWHIPSDRLTHTVAGREDDQKALDELARDIDETAPIPDTVPTRLELTEALRELRAEWAAAVAPMVEMRLARERKVRQGQRLQARRVEAVERRNAKAAEVDALTNSIQANRDEFEVQKAIAQDTNNDAQTRIAARDERNRLAALITEEVDERAIKSAELDGLNSLVQDLIAQIQTVVAELDQMMTDLQVKRAELQPIVADIRAQRNTLRNP